MATKSTQPQGHLLDLPVSSPITAHGLTHAPGSASGDLSRTLTGINENTQIQLALLGSQHEKANTYSTLVGHMHQHAADVYYETIEHHDTLYHKGEGNTLKPYLDEYLVADAKLTARHLQGALEVTAHSMARTVAQSSMPDKLPPQPEQPKRLTMSQRIRGEYP